MTIDQLFGRLIRLSSELPDGYQHGHGHAHGHGYGHQHARFERIAREIDETRLQISRSLSCDEQTRDALLGLVG